MRTFLKSGSAFFLAPARRWPDWPRSLLASSRVAVLIGHKRRQRELLSMRFAGRPLALRSITGFVHFPDECSEGDGRIKQIVVAIDFSENGVAAHNGSVEQ